LIELIVETGSTSADLGSRLHNGELVPEGTWLVADRQTMGRGRQGRIWLDGQGNFMGSTVVHIGFGNPPPATLALVAGLAVHQAVSHFLPEAVTPRLKWPNDVMVGDAKLAGILLERAGEAVIVGIGVNLVASPDAAGRATIALADLGPAPTRDRFAADLAGLFDAELERWRTFGMDAIIRRWLAAGHPLGTPLRATIANDEPVEGTFAGLTGDGALQLRLPDGRTHIIGAGEVHFAEAQH
jgi:BirA family biotin operon repressor/biotin-[acetyl-CoA-carboxylase] ligase